jgi:hypothetical protein
MWMLPAALRARIALITLLGLFLIPVTTSSLRGLTHVLTCRADIVATLSIDTSTDAAAVLGSADRVVRGAEEADSCDDVSVQLDLASTTGDRAELTLEVTNRSGFDRNGSVELQFSGVDIPINVGRIAARSTETEAVTLRVRPDRTYEVTGTLLLGP